MLATLDLNILHFDFTFDAFVIRFSPDDFISVRPSASFQFMIRHRL